MNSTLGLGVLAMRSAPVPLKLAGLLAYGSLPESRTAMRTTVLPKVYDYLGDVRSQIAIEQLNKDISTKRSH